MNPYPTLAQAFMLLVRLMLWSVLFGIPLLVLMRMGVDHPEMRGFVTLVGYALPFVLVIKGAKKRLFQDQEHDTPISFRFAVPKLKLILVLIPLTVAMGFVGEQIAYLVPGTEALEELMQDMLFPSFFTFITIVFLAPLLEELLFRGIILKGFLNHMSPRSSIFWSALLFGLVHMIPAQAASAFVAGLLIGWLYYRTRSLWACIFVHFMNNLLSYGLFLYFGDATTKDMLDGRSMMLVSVISILILMLGIYIIHRDTQC